MINTIIYHDNINDYNKIIKIIKNNFRDLINVIGNTNEKYLTEKLNIQHIDILIVEMSMSSINIINLTHAIHSLFPNCKILLITSYDMIENIHYSINMITTDYIFKPFSETTVINTLRKTIDKIGKKTNLNTPISKLENIRRFLANELFPSLLGGFMTNDNFEQFLKESNIFFKKGFFAVIKFEFNEDILVSRKKYLKKITSEYLYQWEIKENFTVLLYNYNDYIYVFANVPKNTSIEYVINCFSNFEKNIFQEFAVNLCIGIGEFFNTKGHVKSAFYKAQNAEKRCTENNNIVLYNNKENINSNSGKKDSKYGKLLYIKLSKGELNTVYYMIDNILDEFVQNYKDEFKLRKKIYEFFVVIFNELSGEYNLKSLNNTELFFEIIENKKINDMGCFLKEISRNCSYEIEENTTKRNIKILILISDYIKENYSKNITLEYLASQIGISHIYLSKIFKPYFGESFSDYLSKIRIRKSKELLKNPFIKIKDVAYKVGYNDSNYFSKVFKKYTSMTPSEYRSKQIK